MKTRMGSLLDRAVGALRDWSVPRQIAGQDAESTAAESEGSRRWRPRLEEADRIGTSICPYCAVGCGQLIYARGDRILHVEGDPRSPINQGTLCPKGWLKSTSLTFPIRFPPFRAMGVQALFLSD